MLCSVFQDLRPLVSTGLKGGIICHGRWSTCKFNLAAATVSSMRRNNTVRKCLKQEERNSLEMWLRGAGIFCFRGKCWPKARGPVTIAMSFSKPMKAVAAGSRFGATTKLRRQSCWLYWAGQSVKTWVLSLFYHLCITRGVAFPPLRSVLLSVKCEAEIHRLKVLYLHPPFKPEIKKNNNPWIKTVKSFS